MGAALACLGVGLLSRDVLLLSIQADPFRRIQEGTKQYEYRRRFANRPTAAFLYVSSPVKAVCGFVEFGQPIVGSPRAIGEVAEGERPGSGAMIEQFMAGVRQGYAIPVLSFRETPAVSLDALRHAFAPFAAPQSYIILDKQPDLLEYLVRHTGITP
ncbi:MAG: family N-acetyltransferase [Firmicutes bacterium]|nr:family N-acetyltransferase [Bacillota bacterium]